MCLFALVHAPGTFSHASIKRRDLLGNVLEQVDSNLVVLNLSQQTDSADLLGGFQPVEPRHALLPLLDHFQVTSIDPVFTVLSSSSSWCMAFMHDVCIIPSANTQSEGSLGDIMSF